MSVDPVFSRQGKWYFWNEIWTEYAGPFPSEDQAREGLDEWLKYISTGEHNGFLPGIVWHDGEDLEAAFRELDEVTIESARSILRLIKDHTSIFYRAEWRIRYRFWYFIHNAIAHPLLAITPSTWEWPDKFH